MKKFYRTGFFILLSILIGICLIGQAGRWPWLSAVGISFQYGQQRIQSISAGTLRVSAPVSHVLDVDSIDVGYIVSDITTDKITAEDSIVADEIYVQGIFHLASGYMSGDSAWLTDGSIVSSPAAGMILMDTVKDTMIVYDGSAWKVLW